MSQRICQIKVFVSCPGDVEKEKQAVEDACDSLTKIFSDQNIHVGVVDWRKDATPLITGEGAQSVINDQIKEDYDIYVGIFWKRFGDKQSNGLTPTEEEIEKAYRRFKKTRKPLITVYFKTDKFYPNTVYEAEQIAEVQKFKEKIKPLGLYGEFREKEFPKKIFEDIGQIVKKIGTLPSIEVPVSKKKYPEVLNYLPRKVSSTKDYGSVSFSFLVSESSEDIINVIEQNNRIALLSDAGVGKTTELKRVAWHFSKDNSPFYPFFVSLNKYVSQRLSELLPQNWKQIPEGQLLIILDGLDEIESKNRNNSIRQIELFCEQHPRANIIVSCRTNFYKSETKQSSGTLSGFSSYVLLDLDYTEIEKHLKTKLRKTAYASFKKTILDNQLQDLLKIPFYLIRLVELKSTMRCRKAKHKYSSSC